MNLIDVMPDIRGGYLLMTGGDLGVYQPDKSFLRDVELSHALAPVIKAFQNDYSSEAGMAARRLAIVHSDSSEQPWQSATLAFTDSVLHRLFPVSGAGRQGGLTTFQRRNREKSIYRGFEMLLSYRVSALPQTPFFCPVFVYRGTTLGQYSEWVERASRTDKNIPVIEVVDLLAGVMPAQRHDPAIAQLVKNIQANMVSVTKRSDPGLVIIDDVRTSAFTWKENETPADPYGQEVQEPVREFSRMVSANGLTGFNYATWFQARCPETVRHVLGSSLLASAHSHVDETQLRFFDRFKDFERTALQQLADVNPVFNVAAGTRLLDRGSQDHWNLYLVDGELELEDSAGVKKVIVGESPSARRPVAFLKPRLFQVTALSQVKFLWLYEPMIEAMARRQPLRANLTGQMKDSLTG